ncbi:unnamed protein product, partial [Closterium sp. Yama58-4]
VHLLLPHRSWPSIRASIALFTRNLQAAQGTRSSSGQSALTRATCELLRRGRGCLVSEAVSDEHLRGKQ